MKSPPPTAPGAARQYSGTLGGVALCQVAVTLTYATNRGHALIGRALYLPEGCAGDEEHRELAGVPEEILFATKPQLAAALLEHAQSLWIRAAFVAGMGTLDGRGNILIPFGIFAVTAEAFGDLVKARVLTPVHAGFQRPLTEGALVDIHLQAHCP